MYHSLIDEIKVDQILAPLSRTANTYKSTGVDMEGYDGVLFILNVGDIASSGTFDAEAVSDSQANLSTSVDIEGTAITQLTDSDDNKAVAIQVAGKMPARYLGVKVVTAAAASLSSVTAIRYRGRHAPITQAQLDEVVKKFL